MAASRSLRAFQRRLLAWYRVHQRKLPWRETRDPYRILVSEVMLQQTQVDRVIPKYHEFLARYPSVPALAAAEWEELRRLWYPLGYNIRPRRLQDIARQALRDHGGRIPDSQDALLAMKGIGRYTAGAVLAFAYEQDVPMVDTNVARVLARYFGLRGLLKAPRQQRRIWQLAAEVIPRGRGYDINQAMMDLGATVCTARAPQCGRCPLQRACRSATPDARKDLPRPSRHRAD